MVQQVNGLLGSYINANSFLCVAVLCNFIAYRQVCSRNTFFCYACCGLPRNKDTAPALNQNS
ncbi:hypothetical protein C7N43_04680 [Sphingobacteriales bacterium UPWRP_1]|nr:hypothetical protein BVG80_07275 [Sphingobacteriales bacterium TSM_CSM]PSJ78231.1 hypothetical protein C7N43_04680 [Sphingobacteriales bacterium UPWRP_1]